MAQKPRSFRPKRTTGKIFRPPIEPQRKYIRRLYGRRWAGYSRRFLVDHPLCVRCLKAVISREITATVVDHIRPHRGDWSLFWDPDNHQPLCKSCHDRKTAREDGGFGRKQ